MSYVLFSRTSNSNGTRDKWLTGGEADGFIVDGSEGQVNGNDEDVAASEFFDYGHFYNKDAALFGLGALALAGVPTADPAGFDSDLEDAVDDAANDGAGFLNKLDSDFGLSELGADRVLTFALDTAKDWNTIKNIEVDIDDEDLAGVNILNVRGFVDTRIQLGDEDERPGDPDGGADADHGDVPAIKVNVKDAKRGELDASESDTAVHYTLEIASNGSGWQNSFDLRGGEFDDKFIIDVSDSTQLGKSFRNKNADDQANGALTKIVASMGDGDDIYNSAGAAGLNADGTNPVAGLWTVDVVEMGLGLNNVVTGNNFDEIRIDVAGDGVDGGFETVIHDFDVDQVAPPEVDHDTLVLKNLNGGNYDDEGFDTAFWARATVNGLLGSLVGGDLVLSTEAEFLKLADALANNGHTNDDAYIVGVDTGASDDIFDLVFDFGNLRHVVLKGVLSEDAGHGSKMDLADFRAVPGLIEVADYDAFETMEVVSRLTEPDAFDFC